jgi:DNA invertase Pin-like site-specific DNA recombinase
MHTTQDDDTELIPAIGYWRVSRAREEMISPDLQKSSISECARRTGRHIVAWIGDPDKTGRNFKRKITDAIGRVQRGEAREILVYRYDRWGRNAVDSLANVRRVEIAGGSVVSATEPLDPETAIGKYNRTNSFALAEMQSDLIGENWNAVLASRVSSGKPANGTARFGYVRRGRVPDLTRPHQYVRDPADPLGERYEPDPVTGPALAEMYRRYLAGDGCLRLIRWLGGNGIMTTRGRRWTPRTLYGVLDSGFGAGLLRVHDPACRCGAGLGHAPPHLPDEEPEPACTRAVWVPGVHPPVIEPQEWEAYRERRALMRELPPGLKGSHYPLSGLLFCGTATHRLTVASHAGQRGAAYRCPLWARDRSCPGVWVRRAVAEAEVLAWLGGQAADIEAAARAQKARGRAAVTAAVARQRLESAVAQHDRALARLLRQRVSDEGIPDAAYETARADLLADRERDLAALAVASRAETSNSGEFLPVIRSVAAEWDTLPAQRVRELLGMVIREVRVHRTGRRVPPRIEIVPAWAPQEGENQ